MKHIIELGKLSFRIMEAMDDNMNDVENNISQLAYSCRDWAKKNVPTMKLGHTASSIFRDLMYAPDIFDEPVNYRFGDIAKLSNCGETTARVGIDQLAAFALVQPWPGRDPRRLQLCTPDDDLIAWHHERMARLYETEPSRRNIIPIKDALPIWTAFTAKFAEKAR